MLNFTNEFQSDLISQGWRDTKGNSAKLVKLFCFRSAVQHKGVGSYLTGTSQEGCTSLVSPDGIYFITALTFFWKLAKMEH